MITGLPSVFDPRWYVADLRKPTPFEWVLFLVAVLILVAIIGLGAKYPEYQYNILFVVPLSLACAMVFAFLPFQAEIAWQWFKAGGTAAVFGVCLWQLVPYARANYFDRIRSGEAIIASLLQENASKSDEIKRLQQTISKLGNTNNVSSTKAQAARESIEQAQKDLGPINNKITTVIDIAKAAEIADGPTCKRFARQL